MEQKKYRGGRPGMNEQDRSDFRVCIRFTGKQFTQLDSRRKSTKAKDLSAFIRDICLQKPIAMKPQLTTHQEKVLSLLHEIQQDLRRVGVNVNQSTKRINNTTDYQDLQREVNTMTDSIAQLTQQIDTLFQAVNPAQTSDDTILIANHGSPN